MNLIIKGFIIGIGKIIPGVSGAMLAIALGEYNKIINSIATIEKNIKKNTKYLSKIGLGIILAIILTSKIIVKSLKKYYLATMLLFIGIIIGEIPKTLKRIKLKKRDIIISIICLIIIYITTKKVIISKKYEINYTTIEFINIIGIGMLEAISSIVPGISGTIILMSLGYYNIILESFANITNLSLIVKNIFVITPFIIGFIFGTIIITKLINIIIKKNQNIMNIITCIIMICTTISILKNAIINSTNTKELAIGIIFFLTSLLITIKISNKN